MAYIGIDPNVGDISFQTFTGDGSTTTFTLAQSVASGEAIIVTIGNVVQEPGASAAYTAYANTLTFSAAPVNGDVITVRYFGRAVDQPLSYGMQLFKYVATASQTVFTGADSSGTVLAFSGTDVDVYLNGVHLDAADFTASSGGTITLAVGAALNDELVIRAFRAFTITDTVSASSGGTFNGAVTFDAGANFGDNDKAVFGAGSDLQIYHSGAASFISDQGVGRLKVLATDLSLNNAGDTASYIVCTDGGDVQLYHNGSSKFATTATGVDVTGTVTADGATIDGIVTVDRVINATTSADPWLKGVNGSGTETSFLKQDGSAYFGGNVGIGTTSPTTPIQLFSGSANGLAIAGATPLLTLVDTTDSSNYIFWAAQVNADTYLYNKSGAMILGTNNTERMRILSTGDIAFGNTAANLVSNTSTQGGGGYVASDKHFEFATDSNRSAVEIGKNNANDGQLVVFRKQGTTVGSIGTASGGDLTMGTSDTGIRFADADSSWRPHNPATGGDRDNAINIGSSSQRFNDIYATNGTIQTSDANEKQQIAALTDAEITAAKSISQLFKTFKWNSAVEAKGDAARTHAGVIAQDVEAAMTAAGLDAGDYAFFISSTWYVNADGNEVEADAEGAIEKNRKGIRYPELLAFVGAATEQRLANIETRLAALEAN